MIEDKGLIKGILMMKKSEIDTCNRQIKSLKKLKKNIQGELNNWRSAYQKHNSQQVTREVVVRGKFEGRKAEEIRDLYHRRVLHMNGEYKKKIIRICETIDLQISAIETYIGELENGIKQLQNTLDNMEG